ncbi:MAG: hypothetical protein JWP07_3979, partial [Pseudonocardiales bacterium]|nr:hypothetical protein [Pseudonocardiales bacterium]
MNTAPAMQPSHSVSIQDPVGASPVVDPRNGFVYLTGNNGVLNQFQPDLTQRLRDHRHRVPANWVGSTPAVDAAGNIYATFGDPGTPYMNTTLVSYTPLLNKRWAYAPPPKALIGTTEEIQGFLLGSPKIWSQGGTTLIFLVVCYGSSAERDSYVLVLDDSGAQQAPFASIAHLVFVDLHGGGGSKRGAQKMRRASQDRGSVGSGTMGTSDSGSVTISDVPLENSAMPDPSPCIYQDGEGPTRPVVVATDGVEWIAALRYIPGAELTSIWGPGGDYYGYNIGIGSITSSPAVFLNGWLAFGAYDRYVDLVDDPANGGWDDVGGRHKGKLVDIGSRVSATPASFLRQMYVVERAGGLSMFDSNGLLVKSVNLGFPGGESVASPLVSGSFVHVAAADGIYTFDLLLNKQVAHFAVDSHDGMGVSSLAAGPDGTLYEC